MNNKIPKSVSLQVNNEPNVIKKLESYVERNKENLPEFFVEKLVDEVVMSLTNTTMQFPCFEAYLK